MIIRMEFDLEDVERIIRAIKKYADDLDTGESYDYYYISDYFLKVKREINKLEARYDEVKKYGYNWVGMYFFTYDEAKVLFLDSENVIYKCYPDGTESEVDEYDELEDGYWYGIEKENYKVEI